MKITKEDILKMHKKVSREIDLEIQPGFVSCDRTHRNKKKYNRKSQSWKRDWDFSFIYDLFSNSSTRFVNSCIAPTRV